MPRPTLPSESSRALDRTLRGRYTGGACVVIGGGPSVCPEVAEALSPCPFIGTNVACIDEKLAASVVHFVGGVALDPDFIEANFAALERLAFPVLTQVPLGRDALLARVQRSRSIWSLGDQRSAPRQGLARSFAETSFASNSGHAAVQLAVILGFELIGLIGFDGRVRGKGSHYHHRYTARAPSGALDEWAGPMDMCAPLFGELGVDVVNLSSSSALTAYRFVEPPVWRDLLATSRYGKDGAGGASTDSSVDRLP